MGDVISEGLKTLSKGLRSTPRSKETPLTRELTKQIAITISISACLIGISLVVKSINDVKKTMFSK